MDEMLFLPQTTSPAIGNKNHDMQKQQKNHLLTRDLCSQSAEEKNPEPGNYGFFYYYYFQL